jgi:predicted HicB family RNase H-like nuclease
MPENKALNLRDVPADLIRRAKSAAALEGKTLREWVLKAIEGKLKKKVGSAG